MAGERAGRHYRLAARAGMLVLLVVGGSGCASIIEHQRNVAEKRNTTSMERRLWESEAFLRHHPDIRQRKLGFWYQQQGDAERSRLAFEEAARHADKPSQAILAEWYFEGGQLPRDRARAYAWMDLAAERGYPLFVAKREHYWAALDADERQRALEIGRDLYVEYGDSVAKVRMERLLRRGLSSMTGSRVGFVGALEVLLPIDGVLVSMPGSLYYRDEFWRPQQYFEWFDALHAEPPHGVVEVGPFSPEAAAADDRSPG